MRSVGSANEFHAALDPGLVAAMVAGRLLADAQRLARFVTRSHQTIKRADALVAAFGEMICDTAWSISMMFAGSSRGR